MRHGVTFCDREVVVDHNQRPRGFQIAHINRMVICHLWGVREKRNSKRAQKIKLNKLSGSRLALCVNRVKKRLSEPLHARSRLVGGCLSRVKLSRHHSVVGRSLIHRSDPLTWPHATISVTLGALLSLSMFPPEFSRPSLIILYGSFYYRQII